MNDDLRFAHALATNEDGLYHLGRMDPGDTKMAYLYLSASAEVAAVQSHTVHIYDRRPDLPGQARENAAQLYASLHDKLLKLPDDLEIYPGHFSGSVCGVGLSGKPTSTLAFEKRWNPMLSLDQAAFIEALSHVPPKPPEMERVLAFNRGHGEAGAHA